MIEKDLVFIFSGGRTGTAFLGEKLGDIIEDCYSIHEADLLQPPYLKWSRIRTFGFWHMIPGRLLGQAGVRVLGQRLLYGEIGADVVRKRIRASRERLHLRVKQDLVIESQAQFWLVARELPVIWPRAKLIAIVRDPRTWVRSFLNHGARYDDEDRTDWLPPGRLTPAKLGQIDLTWKWDRWGAFEKLAWEWSVIYGAVGSAVEENPRARIWRYEDLFGGDPAHMRELVSFAAEHGARRYGTGDVAAFLGDRVNASSGAARDWQSWTPEQAALVDELCGPLMARWGYGDEPEWRALKQAAHGRT